MRNKADFLSAARNIEEVLGNVKCGKLLESETRSDHLQFGTKVYLTVCLITQDI